jgi:polysaccharide biosynthesis transport protein
VLEGSCEPEEAIQYDAVSNVSIMPAGDVKAAAIAGLYDAARFEKLVQWARADHDLIVIDTPPLGVVNDALLLAKLSDSIIFAVRWGSTSRALVGATLRKLARSKPAAVGIVLTRVDLSAYARYGEQGGYGHLKSYLSG